MRIFARDSQGGFTVTEMIVVLAVISILTVIALTTFGGAKNKAKVSLVRNNINIIDRALKEYAQKNQGRYPGFTDWPVSLPYAVSGRVKSNRIIGGNDGPVDVDSQANQDDYLSDTKLPRSPFRAVLPSRYSVNPNVRMRSIDALYGENLLVPYPDNPLKPPGQGMVNVAYTLGTFQKNINTFSLLPIVYSDIGPRIGLSPGYPNIGNGTYRYSVYQYWWDDYMPNYPAGEFAYIPVGLSDPSGEYATDYWLIGYGDESILLNSPYNQLLDNPNFPNLPRPLGDGNPSTPPVWGSYEHTVRQFVRGALVIKATKYEDQLSINRY
ncbi:type II secretion system GspH family protein [bacterium]|nr:type II secretion system GspH family protein [bacterium]MBU1026011.1 type II secretion system GspH family protein [bacterium]